MKHLGRIGSFAAKTRLSELLEAVERGGSYTITKRNRPVARLVGYRDDLAERRVAATAAMRALRERYRLGGLDVKALREEGRA